MKHIVTTECFDSIPISSALSHGALTPNEADELLVYVSKHGLDSDNIIISRHEVSFINYVGFIQLSSCSIEILPKVSGDDLRQSRLVLLRMLQSSGYLKFHESEISQMKLERMSLLEIMAHLFTLKLSAVLRKGVYKSYRREEGELQLVRGKIDMNRQLRRQAVMKQGVSCIYDEFQHNNPLNQTLKAALMLIMSRSTQLATKKRAAGSLMLLDDVDHVSATNHQHVPMIFDRTNQRFHESYNLAMLLLSGSAPVSTPGRRRNRAILFKMNELFETYVACLIRNHWEQVKLKDRSHKLLIREGSDKGVFQLEPDVVVVNDANQSIIIDTKWKMIYSHRLRHGVKREDFYQMYAYLTRYKEVKDVILLYPYHEGVQARGACLESWHLEGEPDKRLRVFSLSYEDEAEAATELRRMINLL